jgi:excisionase family DNA binding protein
MNKLMMTDSWLSVGEAAKLLGVTKETLKRWEKDNRGVACVRTPAGHRRYRFSDVMGFMNPPAQFTK